MNTHSIFTQKIWETKILIRTENQRHGAPLLLQLRTCADVCNTTSPARSLWWHKGARTDRVRQRTLQQKVNLALSPRPAISQPWPLVSRLSWPQLWPIAGGRGVTTLRPETPRPGCQLALVLLLLPAPWQLHLCLLCSFLIVQYPGFGPWPLLHSL